VGIGSWGAALKWSKRTQGTPKGATASRFEVTLPIIEREKWTAERLRETTMQRWMNAGSSDLKDAGAAGRQAAERALEGRNPKLVIVFCSDSYNLEQLSRGVRALSGEAPLIGCSTAGEISISGPTDAGVVVIGLGGDGFSVAVESFEGASSNLRAAGAHVAGSLTELSDKPHKILMLLTDGLAGDQQEIVRGAYEVSGASIPLVGGCAGDDLKMQGTFQLFGDRILKDSVVGAAIGSDGPFGVGVHHGWTKVGDPMLVTKSADNRVYTLDDRPALDRYLDKLGAPEDARTDPAAFTQFALTHPLGLMRRSGEPQVRFVAEADFNDRSLGCIAEVPQGGMAWFMEGDSTSVLEATEAACDEALSNLTDDPIGMIAFDCIARKGVLGDEGIKVEIDKIAELAGGASVAGFYTYGEIARTKGINGFHNQTLVVLAVS
jgi:hypothetical protein